MRAPYISVVMPSYNERENIVEAIERTTRCLGQSLLEIIVVDDNSPDGTWALVEELKHPRCSLIRRMDKRGLASALADGTSRAAGDVIVWLDCDLGIAPEYIPKLVEQLKDHDAAVGSRYASGGSDERVTARALASYMINAFAGVVFGSGLRDYTSGFAAAHKNLLRQVPLSAEGCGDYFIEWYCHALRRGFTVAEVGYPYRLRKGGTSKMDGDVFTCLRLGVGYVARICRIGWATPGGTVT